MDSSCVKVVHIYQKTKEGYLLFYTVSDFLVFFTVFCREARRWNIRVIGVCPMFDHLHVLVECEDKVRLCRFVQAYTRQYAEEFNLSIGASGSVFEEQFGRAEREGLKEVRSACSYLYNNPGEKKLCRRAEEYRWTFLAFAVSRNPFSEPIVLSKSGFKLRKALKLVDYLRRHDKVLRYRCDYIISTYNCIDFERLISFYGSYEQTCLAFASNQGKEFGLKEEFTPGNHKAYLQISQFLVRKLEIKDVKDVFKLPADKIKKLARLCYQMTESSKRQIEKYFRGAQPFDSQPNNRILSP